MTIEGLNVMYGQAEQRFQNTHIRLFSRSWFLLTFSA